MIRPKRGKGDVSENCDKADDEIRFRIVRMMEQVPDIAQRDHAIGLVPRGAMSVVPTLTGRGSAGLGTVRGKKRYACVSSLKGLSEETAIARLLPTCHRKECVARKRGSDVPPARSAYHDNGGIAAVSL